MSSRRDLAPCLSVRLTPEEDVWLRRNAAAMRLDLAEVVRKSLSLAVPQLRGNPFLRRVTMQDAMTDEKCL